VINTVKVINENSSFNIAGDLMMGGTGTAVHYSAHKQSICGRSCSAREQNNGR
jgi:hypothetical protein